MKEEKIREKYPNIRSEEEYEKLNKMLKYQNNERVAMLWAVCSFLLGALLYKVNSIIAFVGIAMGFALWIIGTVCWGRHIDKFFVAKASRRKIENRVLLTHEEVNKSIRNFTIKKFFSDLVSSLLLGFFCMIVWGLYLTFADEADTEVPVLLFFVIIPITFFAIIRICSYVKKRKSGSSDFLFIKTKLNSRKSIDSSDPESSSTSYYFTFRCMNYGELDFEVDSNSYHAASVGEDEYYVVVLKKRFSKKYEIAKIYSEEKYELSPELKQLVESY